MKLLRPITKLLRDRGSDIRRRTAYAALAFVLSFGLVAAGPLSATAKADPLPLPWPFPGSIVPLPPDPTAPYLSAVNPLCPEGSISCFQNLEAELTSRNAALVCDHDTMFTDSYLTITRALIDASTTPGFFQRADRLNHEAFQYAHEYLDQYDRWHAGNKSSVSPAWNIAFQAAEDESVTATGDLLLQLGAHILRDNPIRAIEQSEGVLRVQGTMPGASGRFDHDRVNDVLQDSLQPMLAHLAQHYDPTTDDAPQVLGTVIDPDGLYSIIWGWRELAWRNAEELRHARALGGVNGILYQLKLAQIEETARLTAVAIKAATLTTPAQNAARNAYCAAHVND